jgi:hypothetical protein
VSLWRPKARRTRKALTLGLDLQQLAWLPEGAPSRESITAGHLDGVAQALAGVPPGAMVNVIAANDIALHWLQTPPLSVASFGELRLTAAARCAHLYGGSLQDWWIAGNWSARQPFPCAALPQSVAIPLSQQLAQSGVRVHWHTAWGLMCSARAGDFPSDGWSAVASPSRVVLWHCRASQVNCLAVLSVDACATEQQIAGQALQQMQVEALRSDDAALGVLHWLNLGQREEMSSLAGLERISVGPAPSSNSGSEAALALGLDCLLQGSG